MKANCRSANKWLEYERRKAALQAKGLPQKEYDRAMQALIKELRV